MITAFVGLLGIAIGAWLNATLTTRRERWNLRRDLYTRLLEHIGEAVDALELLEDAVLRGHGDSDEAEKRWDSLIDHLRARESRAEEEIRRARSVAAIMLSDEAIKVLWNLQKEWNQSVQAESWEEHVSLRVKAAQKAYAVLVTAAKNDLFRWRYFRVSGETKQGRKVIAKEVNGVPGKEAGERRE